MEQRSGKYKVVDIKQIYDRRLYKSLYIASNTASYSMCVEYIKKWFLNKFSNDFFRAIHVETKHLFDDQRNLSNLQKLKRMKPSLLINPIADLNFNNEFIDSIPYGINTWDAQGEYRNAFFNDYEKNIKLGFKHQVQLVDFNFRLRFSTRAQQIDMHKYIKNAFRLDYSEGTYINVDYHIPYPLILQLAKDLGYEVNDDDLIVNVIDFIAYINSKSLLPITYKLRTINRKHEFFMRMNDVYVHIKTTDLSSDDGEQEGQITSNYITEFSSRVRFPAPMYYSYYSENYNEEIIKIGEYDSSKHIIFDTIRLPDIPILNENGWSQYLSTDYVEKCFNYNIVVDFKELFEGKLLDVINYTKKINISPDIFLDIKVFNDGKLINTKMDWNSLQLYYIDIVKNDISAIIIYADLEYINNTLKILDPNIEKTRVD